MTPERPGSGLVQTFQAGRSSFQDTPRIVLGASKLVLARIAPRLRAADLAEIRRATGLGAVEALTRSVAVSAVTFHIIHQGRPEAIGGVVTSPADARVGVPWMVGTDMLTARRQWLIRNTAALWAIVESPGYAILSNLVDAENAGSLRWLRHSGCQFGQAQSIGGHPFVHFSRMPNAHQSGAAPELVETAIV